MARKIRFPLEMCNGIEVRTMEELRNNFSLVKVIEYIRNEKLVTWLRDRYEESIADAVEALDKEDEQLAQKVSAIFGIAYDENTEENLKIEKEKAERIKRLKEITDEKRFIDKIDRVAFDQDELYDLLDEDVKEIYLCSDRFNIPLAVQNVTYIGIKSPTVVIDSKVPVDFKSKGIVFEEVIFDEKYQAVLDSYNTREEYSYAADIGEDYIGKGYIGEAPKDTYLRFMLKASEREESKRMYEFAREIIGDLYYNVDADISGFKRIVYDSNVIGIAENFINEL